MNENKPISRHMKMNFQNTVAKMKLLYIFIQKRKKIKDYKGLRLLKNNVRN